MTVVYVLAHFDDEFLALPLIWRDAAQGRDLQFIHVADYRDPRAAGRRHAETLAFLAAQGIAPTAQVHLGAGTGWWDGELCKHAGAAFEALQRAAPGPVERVVVPAWEGGHPDHDVCAALGVGLAAARGGAPVDQVPLYQGKGLPWILYRASRPIAENGAAREIALRGRDWRRWFGSVRAFPSQLHVWAALVPNMALTFAQQRAFRYQALAPARLAERPHTGPLHYERMFKTPYAAVRAAVDSLP
jgi:hypothetical protein